MEKPMYDIQGIFYFPWKNIWMASVGGSIFFLEIRPNLWMTLAL